MILFLPLSNFLLHFAVLKFSLFLLQLQDEVLASDTERLSMTHSNVKKVWFHMSVSICTSEIFSFALRV
jgi:hypothetical protein